MLCESTAGGLELKRRDGSWVAVPSVRGQIVVDAADMIQHFSNGVFRSTTHRVVQGGLADEARFSMPFFAHPRKEVDLSPPKACLDLTGGKALYEQTTAGEFLAKRLAEIGLT